MSWKGKVVLVAGALIMVTALILELISAVTLEQLSVLFLVGLMVSIHPLDYKKRTMIARDEFIRRVNMNSMARSWKITQYLVVALIFATVLGWITLGAIWVLIIVSVFMTVSYLLFMIPMFNKGEVE
jgi:hypothetical protein